MPFGMVSGVSRGMGALDTVPHASRGRGGFWGHLPPLAQWFQWRILQQKCIRLVHEKLIIFPYGQYIIGIYISLLSKDVLKFEVDARV